MPEPLRFGEFDLDVERYELRRSGRTVKLERIPMELLILLLQSEGKLVRREAINRRLWGENALQDTEHSVNTAVNKLRFILRDDPREPRFIQTVVGQGYRFIAKVAVARRRSFRLRSSGNEKKITRRPLRTTVPVQASERRVAEASIPPVLPSESSPPALPSRT